MFYELDLVSRFGLDHNVLCRWLLTTKKNYRVEVLYHNWNHAFNVAQVLAAGCAAAGCTAAGCTAAGCTAAGRTAAGILYCKN